MAGSHSPRHSPQGQARSHPPSTTLSPPHATKISTAPTSSLLPPPKAPSSTDSLNHSSGVSSSSPNGQTPPKSTPKAVSLNSTPPRPLPLTATLSPAQKATVTSPNKRPSDSDSSSSSLPPPASTAKPSAGPSQKRQRRAPKTAIKDIEESPVPSRPTEADEDSESRMASERPRLSEQEKKNNHIASEQKRRMAIREGFDRLTEIVPGLEGQGRSESIVLKKCLSNF